MKSQLIKEKLPVIKERPSFPLLAQSLHGESKVPQSFIVLFIAPNEGTVVWREGNAGWMLGVHHNGFSSCFGSEHWRILSNHETIAIHNTNDQ